jgi:ribosome-binding factor A
MANHKIDRIASDILKYLGSIIANETRDELLKTVTLTEVKVSKDLCYAKVYFTSISGLSHKEMEKEMMEAAPFLRGCLAKVIEIRNIPELQFVYDESIEYATKIEKIITKIHND